LNLIRRGTTRFSAIAEGLHDEKAVSLLTRQRRRKYYEPTGRARRTQLQQKEAVFAGRSDARLRLAALEEAGRRGHQCLAMMAGVLPFFCPDLKSRRFSRCPNQELDEGKLAIERRTSGVFRDHNSA
jgi:hypothetical protein